MGYDSRKYLILLPRISPCFQLSESLTDLSFKVYIPLDANSRTSKGLAYVTFVDPTNAVAAYEALDKTSFQGRLLHILGAVNRKGKIEVEEAGKKRNLKEDRDAKRKLTAGKEFNWGMLYMNVRTIPSEYISLYLFLVSIERRSCFLRGRSYEPLEGGHPQP